MYYHAREQISSKEDQKNEKINFYKNIGFFLDSNYNDISNLENIDIYMLNYMLFNYEPGYEINSDGKISNRHIKLYWQKQEDILKSVLIKVIYLKNK